MRWTALSVIALSLILLTLSVASFFKVSDKVQKANANPAANTQAAISEIGRVLGYEDGDVLPGNSGGSTYYKFYLKDQTGTAINNSGESSDKALIKGATVTVTNKSSFTCGDGGANYTFTDYDGLYKILCNESATMNVRISKSGYSTKNTTLAPYDGDISTIYLSRYVAPPPPPPPPPPETIKNVTMPAEFTETGGSTNLSSVSDPAKVENLTLDTDSNTIKYTEAVDLSSTETKDKFKELNKYVKADQKGVVAVDSTSLPVLNKKATITMKSLTFVKTPKVYVDGKEDKAAVVSNVKYSNGTLTFDVTHFSTFTVVPTIEIREPDQDFKTTKSKITVKGSVSDPTASVSAKLNDKDAGKVTVATDGAFAKEITMEEGSNSIVISALGENLATAAATVSGEYKKLNLTLVLSTTVILAGIAIAGIFYGIKKFRKPKAPTIPTPTTS